MAANLQSRINRIISQPDMYEVGDILHLLADCRKHIDDLETRRAWENPYSKAISLLQNAARAYEGSYG